MMRNEFYQQFYHSPCYRIQKIQKIQLTIIKMESSYISETKQIKQRINRYYPSTIQLYEQYYRRKKAENFPGFGLTFTKSNLTFKKSKSKPLFLNNINILDKESVAEQLYEVKKKIFQLKSKNKSLTINQEKLEKQLRSINEKQSTNSNSNKKKESIIQSNTSSFHKGHLHKALANKIQIMNKQNETKKHELIALKKNKKYTSYMEMEIQKKVCMQQLANLRRKIQQEQTNLKLQKSKMKENQRKKEYHDKLLLKFKTNLNSQNHELKNLISTLNSKNIAQQKRLKDLKRLNNQFKYQILQLKEEIEKFQKLSYASEDNQEMIETMVCIIINCLMSNCSKQHLMNQFQKYSFLNNQYEIEFHQLYQMIVKNKSNQQLLFNIKRQLNNLFEEIQVEWEKRSQKLKIDNNQILENLKSIQSKEISIKNLKNLIKQSGNQDKLLIKILVKLSQYTLLNFRNLNVDLIFHLLNQQQQNNNQQQQYQQDFNSANQVAQSLVSKHTYSQHFSPQKLSTANIRDKEQQSSQQNKVQQEYGSDFEQIDMNEKASQQSKKMIRQLAKQEVKLLLQTVLAKHRVGESVKNIINVVQNKSEGYQQYQEQFQQFIQQNSSKIIESQRNQWLMIGENLKNIYHQAINHLQDIDQNTNQFQFRQTISGYLKQLCQYSINRYQQILINTRTSKTILKLNQSIKQLKSEKGLISIKVLSEAASGTNYRIDYVDSVSDTIKNVIKQELQSIIKKVSKKFSEK